VTEHNDDRAPEPTPPDSGLPPRARELLASVAGTDRSAALALHAILASADERGSTPLDAVARRYRDDHLAAVRAEGRDAEREAGRLSLDEVRHHLATSVLPRLAGLGLVTLHNDAEGAVESVRVAEGLWREVQPQREAVASALRQTGEHHTARPTPVPSGNGKGPHGSVLEAHGLVKIYRRRHVVDDVALRLQQGEIVGLLGPNGAGKTTTFYMIVGLIAPNAGRILLDGEDITGMPMYRRARRGIGYLSQEPSIFRKLSVEDNILAILETLPISRREREERLEKLLGELSIEHLRDS
jgi:lipopolysaccharide export system ATP-binding protein